MELFEAADGAVEGAFEAGVVAAEAVEFALELLIVECGEGVDAAAEAGFHAADAAEVPGGVDDLIEQGLLEDALGLELAAEVLEEFVELGLFVGLDDEVLGAEAVGAGVLAGSGFAGFGTGAGAELGVALVGVDACGAGGHVSKISGLTIPDERTKTSYGFCK